ncbi:MAG: glucose-6-phosphate isomerase [Gammaproteobacteria bacterium]
MSADDSLSSDAVKNPAHTPAWQALLAHYRSTAERHMRDLFRQDPDRGKRLSLEAAGLFVDFSKNRILDETLHLLCALAEECGVGQAIGGMFRGAKLNTTEQRAVLHTALRKRSDEPVFLDGENVMPYVLAELEKMRSFCDAVHRGQWRGYSGKRLTDAVHIGIGGSHLGPLLVTQALIPYRVPGMQVHFVSNVDSADIYHTLSQLDPETTLFIVASKTFTTQETMANAHTAKQWFLSKAQDASAVGRHFVALSTNVVATKQFGIANDNVFAFWDWVGGRYSVWSSIGLPVVLSIGMENFEEFLRGAYLMDEHFRCSDPFRNAPLVLALLGVWYVNFFGLHSQAIIPYDRHLDRLPNYLQQLDMESNGKSVNRDGQAVDYATGGVIWGAPGTDSQHAFFQLLHQGTHVVPVDFILGRQSHYPMGKHQEMLLANCLAQAEALMCGKTAAEVKADLLGAGMPPAEIERLAPHRTFPGNKPSTMILYEKLTPRTLGALLALYEHKVFVQGRIWGINSFDQWGVELGKQLAGPILSQLTGGETTKHDSSTANLIARCSGATTD